MIIFISNLKVWKQKYKDNHKTEVHSRGQNGNVQINAENFTCPKWSYSTQRM
jgi:hypothetical protein